MTVEELNELVEAAYEAAFLFEEELSGAYQAAFQRAARRAEVEFKRQVVVAAGFVAPEISSLTSGMTVPEQNRTDSIRRQAAEAVAAALIVLGLGAIAKSFMDALAQRGATNFEDEVLLTLRRIVQRGLDEGWTADETASALAKSFQGLSSPTAQMLAQTELTTLVNERSIVAASKFQEDRDEPLYKVWQTMRDARVRAAHAAAQSQTVPIAQPFSVGGYLMMYPGDPSAPMTLVARCRCRMTYTDSLSASAVQLIPRDEFDRLFEASRYIASAEEATLMSMSIDSTVPGFVVTQFPATSATTNPALTSSITITINDDAETEQVAAEGAPWKALLAIEGQPTEDGRMIEKGALSWRELPLTLMALTETGPGGHEGAQVAGRIDSIYRSEENEAEVWGAGVFDTGEFGQEIERMVGEQTLRGNSVDLAVTAYEYRNAETGEVLEGDALWDALFSDVELLFVVTEGIVMASTVCPTPAINGAEIMLASGMMRMTFSFTPSPDAEVLTASAAGMVPLHPPVEWFANPSLDGPTPLTVTNEGHVYGHAALWNSCHIGEPSGPGICVPPPRTGLSYSIFHHGAVECEDGTEMPCGQITMSTLHAGRDLGWKAAQEHYEHSGIAVADVAAGEDAHGIWLSGALRPDLPAERVREMKAGSLSGDWRQVIDRGLEFLAALVVNIPGFPIPRPEARIVASALGEEEVLALVAAGMVTEEDVQGLSRREYLRQIGVLTR